MAASLLYASQVASAEEEITFDASEYEKRAFDFGGYAEVWPDYLPSNQDGALYELAFFGEDPEADISRFKGALELEGRYSRDIFTAMLRAHSNILWDYRGEQQQNALYEGVVTLQPSTGLAIEGGKKVNRWGKGIFWNPVAFIERPKDPNDPDLAREGFWMGNVDWVRSFNGPLQTLGITPVVVPTIDDLNQDFGAPGNLNFAGKIYLLYRDTDIDLLFLTEGSRTARFGFDFSRNLAPNFEIHGEFAYITNFRRVEIEAAPSCRPKSAGTEDVISYLLGLRYRTEQDITYTLEYYSDGTGNTARQQRRYYECIHTGWDEDDAATIDRLRSPELTRRFVRPNPMRQYVGLRAAWNEPFDMLYLTPALQAFYNADDRSFQLAPEISYSGIDNLEVRLRGTFPFGSELTEWGEKANEYKIDLRVRYYF